MYNSNSNTYWYDPSNTADTDQDPYNVDPNETDMDVDNSYSGDPRASNATATSEGGTTTGISVWTVYIIVGSVAGGILLAGLIAIAIALCCQKEEDAQYKSTSVWLWRQGAGEGQGQPEGHSKNFEGHLENHCNDSTLPRHRSYYVESDWSWPFASIYKQYLWNSNLFSDVN